MAELTPRERTLLERALDGELSEEERLEFDRLRGANENLEYEWNSLHSLKEVTMTMKFKSPGAETWDRYWAGVYARMERGVAWVLVSIGAALLLAAAGYQAVLAFLNDTETPVFMKIGIGALVLGGAILVVSVLREKLAVRKTDPYKEVVR